MYHLIFPVVGTIFYFNIKWFSFNIHPQVLFAIAFLHNTALTVFSAYTFINMTSIICRKGIAFQSNYYFSDPQFDSIVFYFYLSKYYEYGDTFLLYLQHKKPIFLQTFHHCGAVICWHLCYFYKVDFVWMATWINALVHTVMYSYYTMALLKMEFIRKYKQYITTLQIVQLLLANIISPIMYYPPVETAFKYSIVMIFNGYVAVLVVLFVKFAGKTYITK